MTNNKKFKMVCRTCGGENVMRDAFAQWDKTRQDWVLMGDPFDQAHCDDCERETNIDMMEITDGQP